MPTDPLETRVLNYKRCSIDKLALYLEYSVCICMYVTSCRYIFLTSNKQYYILNIIISLQHMKLINLKYIINYN